MRRNPVKPYSFDKFNKLLEENEKEHNVKLKLSLDEDFSIKPDNRLSKPFKKKQVIEAEIKGYGRKRTERLAVAKDRTINVFGCPQDYKLSGKANVRIIRDKHNIFVGKLLNQ